jgi:hypothetical protein
MCKVDMYICVRMHDVNECMHIIVVCMHACAYACMQVNVCLKCFFLHKDEMRTYIVHVCTNSVCMHESCMQVQTVYVCIFNMPCARA